MVKVGIVMRTQENVSLTKFHGKIFQSGAESVVKSREFYTTVDSLDYFNVNLLKSSISNCTTLKEQPLVSNNTIIG
jgi:hypothetical protein